MPINHRKELFNKQMGSLDPHLAHNKAASVGVSVMDASSVALDPMVPPHQREAHLVLIFGTGLLSRQLSAAGFDGGALAALRIAPTSVHLAC